MSKVFSPRIKGGYSYAKTQLPSAYLDQSRHDNGEQRQTIGWAGLGWAGDNGGSV